MTVRRMLGVLAGVLVLSGVLLLLVPTSAADASAGRIDCGSVLSPDVSGPSPAAGAAEVEIFNRLRSECEDAIVGRQVTAWTIVGFGVLGLVLVAVVPAVRRRTALSPEQQ